VLSSGAFPFGLSVARYSLSWVEGSTILAQDAHTERSAWTLWQYQSAFIRVDAFFFPANELPQQALVDHQLSTPPQSTTLLGAFALLALLLASLGITACSPGRASRCAASRVALPN